MIIIHDVNGFHKRKEFQENMQHSLEVFKQDKLIFYSDAHWLHPLLELQNFLKQNIYNPQELFLKDKIIGRAAALILVHFGFKKVHGELMSRLAREVLDYYAIDYTFDQLIDRIACQTEELLKSEWNGHKAYLLIKNRIEN